MQIDQAAIEKIADSILKVIEQKLSENNTKVVGNALKNHKVDGDHIVRESIGNVHIKDAAIDTAKIKDLTAEIARIAVAEIGVAVIDVAQIESLSAYVANIVNATIQSADIEWADIANLTATIAAIAVANIETARINFAQIDGLTAGVALIQEVVGGKVQIANLSVSDANIVTLNANKIQAGTLSVERLVIVGSTESIVYAVNEANGTAQLSQTTIDGGSITQKTITADQIIAHGITADCLNVAEIFANEALIGAITTANIAAGTITAASAIIADGAITTAKIGNAQITSAKIADANITTAKIGDAQITGAKIADANITTAKIGDAQITGAKIANATITNANIAEATINSANIGNGQITTAKIGDAQITNAKINDLNASKINAGTLSADRIAAGSITTDKLAAAAVTADKIDTESLVANNAVIQSIKSNSNPRVASLPSAPVVGETIVYTGATPDVAIQWTGKGINPTQRNYAVSKSGAGVAIEDLHDERALSVTVKTVAQQLGSGTVSPDNIRPIVPRAAAQVIQNKRNVLKNAGWVSDTNGWSLGAGTTHEPGKVRFGNGSIRLTLSGLSTNGHNGASNAIAYYHPTAVGDKWTGSVFAWVYDHTKFDQPLTLYVWIRDAALNIIRTASTAFTPSSADVGKWIRITVAHTVTDAEAAYVSIGVLMTRNGDCSINSPQLEYGDVLTNYNGSAIWETTALTFDTSAYGILGFEDEIGSDGHVIHRTAITPSYDGTETVSNTGTAPAATHVCVVLSNTRYPGKRVGASNLICNYLPPVTLTAGIATEGIWAHTTGQIGIVLSVSRLAGYGATSDRATHPNAVKAWLANKYGGGSGANPFRFVYELATPIAAAVDTVPLLGYDGTTTTITSDGAAITVEYTGSGWKRISNSIVGTNVEITDEKFRVATKEVEFAITGGNGEESISKIDEGGAYFPSIEAPNAAIRWPGPYTITVNPSLEPDEESGIFNTLQSVGEAISSRTLDGTLTINITSGAMLYGDVTFKNVSSGYIAIKTTSTAKATIKGYIYVNDCPCGVGISNLQILAQGDIVSSVGTNRANLIFLDNCIISRGTYTGNCVHVDYGTSAFISNCELYGGRGLFAAPTSRVAMTNCKGGGYNNGAVLSNGATVLCSGTIPAGTYTTSNNGILTTTGCTQDAGTSAAVVEDTIATYNAASSGWYRSSWQSGSEMRQGYTSYELSGCFWLNNTTVRAALAGKTIKDVKLTLRRKAGYGVSGAIKVRLRGTTATGKSGGQPDRPKSYGTIGSIKNGQTATFSIPVAAINDLVSGVINGFVLYASDGDTLSGKTYSANYGVFYGGSSGDGPKITVTY